MYYYKNNTGHREHKGKWARRRGTGEDEAWLLGSLPHREPGRDMGCPCRVTTEAVVDPVRLSWLWCDSSLSLDMAGGDRDQTCTWSAWLHCSCQGSGYPHKQWVGPRQWEMWGVSGVGGQDQLSRASSWGPGGDNADGSEEAHKVCLISSVNSNVY